MKGKLFLKEALLCLLMMALLLSTACTFGSSDKESAASDFGLKIPDISKSSSKEVTLTFGFSGNSSGDRKVLDELEKAAKKDMNVKLDFKWSSSASVYDMVKNAVASDSQCDFFCVDTGFDYNNLKKLERDGFAMDLKELFPRYAPNYYKKFTKEDLAGLTVNGKLLAIPNYLPMSMRRNALVREDLMKKYSIPQIKNYEDFEVYLKKIKDKEPDLIPLYLNFTQSGIGGETYDSALLLFAESYGYAVLDTRLGLVYKWDDPECKIIAWEQAPEYKKALETLNRWKTLGYFSEKINYFTAGKYASMLTVPIYEPYLTNVEVDNSFTDHIFKAYPLYLDKTSQRYSSYYGGLVLNAKSQNPERAIAFIEWLYSKQEYYDILMYGIKGKNYVLYGDQFDIPKNADVEAYEYWNWIGFGALQNFDLDRIRVPNAPDFKQRFLDSIKENTRYAPSSGFVIDESPVEEIAGVRKGGYISMEERIRQGMYSSNDIDGYIKEQKKNGVDKLISTVQKQFDDWRAKNN